MAEGRATFGGTGEALKNFEGRPIDSVVGVRHCGREELGTVSRVVMGSCDLVSKCRVTWGSAAVIGTVGLGRRCKCLPTRSPFLGRVLPEDLGEAITALCGEPEAVSAPVQRLDGAL